jgi:Mrp family chromosome partitioning ATPase
VDKIRQALDRARREREDLEADLESAPPDGSSAHERVMPVLVPPPAFVPAAPESAGSAEAPEPDETAGAGRAFQPDPAALERSRVLAPGASGTTADIFRLLRTQVLDRMRKHGWQTLGVVSARAADGKTTLASNLAISIASDPRYTALLVDLDLRRPAVGAVFGVSVTTGVEDVLRGEAPVEACLLRPTSFNGLRLLPARGSTDGSSTLVAGTGCAAFVKELRSRYANRVIVFDLPPVLEADDAAIVAAQLDCALFVVAEGRTARAEVAKALDLLSHTPVIGTVLNASTALPRARAQG